MRLWSVIGGIILVVGLNGAGLAQPPGPPHGLPPGLEKNVEQGKPLPPGWQKKLRVGHILDRDIYRHGRVLHRDGRYITLGIEDRRVRLIENTLEIVEILDSMN